MKKALLLRSSLFLVGRVVSELETMVTSFHISSFPHTRGRIQNSKPMILFKSRWNNIPRAGGGGFGRMRSTTIVQRMSDRVIEPITPDSDDLNRKQMDAIEAEVEEATEKTIRFLSISIEKMKSDLSKNWGWAVTAGVLTMIVGVTAFSMPIFATAIAYESVLLTVACVGAIGIGGFIFGETGKKLKYGISGLFYGALAYVMGKNPLLSINVMTCWIATLLFGEGLYETLLAFQNQLIDGRVWLFVNGIVSMIASAVLIGNMPATSIVVPGLALAVRLISTGAAQFSLGLLGRDLANAKL